MELYVQRADYEDPHYASVSIIMLFQLISIVILVQKNVTVINSAAETVIHIANYRGITGSSWHRCTACC